MKNPRSGRPWAPLARRAGRAVESINPSARLRQTPGRAEPPAARPARRRRPRPQRGGGGSETRKQPSERQLKKVLDIIKWSVVYRLVARAAGRPLGRRETSDDDELDHSQTRDDGRPGGRLAAVRPLSGRGRAARQVPEFVTLRPRRRTHSGARVQTRRRGATGSSPESELVQRERPPAPKSLKNS